MNRPGSAEKFAFFAGVAGSILISNATGFILLYLTKVIGLGAATVATLLLVARILDAALDPVLGYAVDHLPATRWGRFRPYALAGGVLAAIFTIALFSAPAYLPGALVWAWVTYLLWGAAIGVMGIPITSLLPTVTDDARVRSQLAGVIAFTGLLVGAASTGLTLPVVDAFGGGVNGWLSYGVAVAGFGVIAITWMAARVRERVVPVSSQRYRLSEVRRVFFSGRAVPILLLVKVTTNSASGAMLAALPFFFLYNVGDKDLIGAAAAVMALPMVGGSIVMPMLARRSGVKPYYLASLGFAVVGLALLLVLPAKAGPVLACLAVVGVGFGGAVSLNFVMLAELTDYTEWQHGYRAEASLAAMVSFATKAGTGIGGAMVGYTLALTGYDGRTEHQTAAAVHGVLLSQSVVPAAIAVLGGLIFLAYPISKHVAEQATAALVESRSVVMERV